MFERRVRIKLVDEHVRPGKPVLHRTVCDFVKHSYGDQTGKWKSEPWGVAQFPMSRKEHEHNERLVAAHSNWEEIEAAAAKADRSRARPNFDELGVLKRLPDGSVVLQVPPRKPTLMVRWEKVIPLLDRIAMERGYLSPDDVVLVDGDAATLTITELRSLVHRF